MSTENVPEKGIRPSTDILIECPNGHPILARYSTKGPLAHFSTYPWDYSGEIAVGTTEIVPKGFDKLTCPHCPGEESFNIDTKTMWLELNEARFPGFKERHEKSKNK